MDAQTVDLASLERFLIVDERDRFEVRPADQNTGEASAGITGSVDCDPRRGFSIACAREQIANEEAASYNIQERDGPIDGQPGCRQFRGTLDVVVCRERDNRQRDACDDRQYRLWPHEPDDRAIQT